MARDNEDDRPKKSRADRSDSNKESAARDEGLRARLEGAIPDVLRRAVVTGLGAIFMTEETIRSAVSDMPKDAVKRIVSQADQTKEQLLALIAREFREVLEETDLGELLTSVLTHLALEIKTEIRFKEAGEPQIKHDVRVRKADE